jgi:hypothetical protein
MSQFTGWGRTLDEAVDAATKDVLEQWKPAGPDDMIQLHVDSIGVMYGGIVGHVGTRAVTVSLPGKVKTTTLDGTKSASLVLALDVIPDPVWVNLMPGRGHRPPQPRKIGLLLTVKNVGEADFDDTCPNSAVAHFSVLKGRTEIWHWPENVLQVITPVKLRPGEAKTYKTEWEVEDATPFVGAELHAAARFVPFGQWAMRDIHIMPAW